MDRVARLFVLSGPSGAGKGTILKRVLEQRPELSLTVSATTRKPRTGEVEGVAYYFMDDDSFQRLVAQDAVLEWARVHDHCYGTLRREVDQIIAQGRSVVLEIDVQGALNVRKQRPDAVLLFVEPPSMEVLEQRLRARGSETPETLALRLANAHHEMDLASSYDARIVNDNLDDAVQQTIALIEHYETVEV